MNPTALREDLLMSVPPTDELMQWELRIAQRADELAAQAENGHKQDLIYWLQAEREVLEQMDAPPEFISS